MASSPPSHQLDVPLFGSSVSVVRRCAPSLKLLLQSRFQCEVQVLGLGLDPVRSRPPVVPEKRLETTLLSGVRVSVWKGDLTDFPEAEAVVNAANSKLQHHGGLARALSEAGGARVQQDSDDHVRANGQVKTGDAVALSAGNLKYKTIIHAVGPRLSLRPNVHEVSAGRSLLETAVRSVLEIVEKHQLKTIAIPAISSGIFNFPVDQCADAIVSTVRRFYGSSTSHRFMPTEVFLVNHDEPTVKEMEQAFKKLLPQPSSSRHTGASGTSSHSSAPALYSHVTSSGGGGKHQTSTSTSGGVQTRGSIKGNAPPEVQLGLMRVLLRKGCLEEQKMDVIVNTASTNRDLSMGRVSNALLMKAGHRMQEEIRHANSHNSILITGSYNLQCRQVYHTFCPDRYKEGSHQILFQSVQDCLMAAVNSQHRSIAFPAIGTGALGFKNREAAQTMVTAVSDFSRRCLVPFEVHFVIFQRDAEVFKAFEEELQSVRVQVQQAQQAQQAASSHVSIGFTDAAQSVNTPEPRSAPGHGWGVEPQRTPSEPCLRLQSPSGRSLHEAEAWLRALLHNHDNTVYFSNNFTQLLGESELEELSHTPVEAVQVEEFLDRGRSGMMVRGERQEDIAVTAVELQAMLQKVQTKFMKEEVEELKAASQSSVKMERSPVSSSDSELRPFINQLQKHGLHVTKTERVENPALEKLFKLRKAQMPSPSSDDKLLQLVPAQFCKMVSYIGFRPECAPPDDSCFGEGLYFAADVPTALRVWTERSDRFLYVFVAEVLKGRCGRGRGQPGLVLAPGLDSGADPAARYDSVEGSGVTVMFDHRQALPRFIITCRTDKDVSGV